MEYKHAVVNKAFLVVVEMVSARAKIQTQAFRLFLTKKFPEANGDFTLLYKDIDNDYFLVETGERVDKNGAFENLAKAAWKGEVWRGE